MRLSRAQSKSHNRVHSGHEASAVDHTFASITGMFATIKGMLFNSHPNQAALEALNEPGHGHGAPASAPISLTISAPKSPPTDREREPANIA